MKSLAKIPATVITGFLGAGKTTLVRHLLQNNQGRKIALVINEFGDLGVDREMIRGCGIEDCEDGDIVELANGCICCTVADEFLPTIEALIGRENPPDHIVIETSGLALPKPLVKAFNWPEVRSKVTVDGVIAVIDAAAVCDGRFAHDPKAVQAQREADDGLDHDNPLEEVFSDQLSCADMVLVNKIDLLDDATRQTVLADLQVKLRPGVHVVPTSHGVVDVDVLLGLTAAVEDDIQTRHGHHNHDHDHDHDDFDSFVITLPEMNPEGFEARLIETITAHDILRVKGFLDVPGKPMRQVVQAVGTRVQRYFDRAWADDEARASQLVVIGLHGLDKDAITATLKG